MNDSMNKLVASMIALSILLGFLFGKGCTENAQKPIIKHDTITSVKIQPRQVFVKPDVLIKSILVPYKDTMKVLQKIPCDTAFIAQADSVITTTGDTINVAFNHSPKESFFSMVVKPRPDSIIYRDLIVEKTNVEKQTEFGWLVSAFIAGIAVGILGAK